MKEIKYCSKCLMPSPDYYNLLQEFEKIIGRGVLLNTSFNLHGKPVVLGPREAIFTFKNSGLDALVLGNHLILKTSSIENK